MKTSTTRRRSGLAALLAVLALTFTACGADGGDDVKSTTTTTTASNDDGTTTTEANDTPTTESDGTTTTEPGGPSTSGNLSGMAKDAIVETYKGMGLSDEQAKCAADFVLDKVGDMRDMQDVSGLMKMGKDMFKKCDIDPSDLKVPSGN
jgi:hypothetical protein